MLLCRHLTVDKNIIAAVDHTTHNRIRNRDTITCVEINALALSLVPATNLTPFFMGWFSEKQQFCFEEAS